MTVLSNATQQRFAALMGSDTSDIPRFIELTGIDPTHEFRYADLTGSDFGEIDVAKWDLSGTVLRNARLGQVKNLEKAILDAQTDLTGAQLPLGITTAQLFRR